MKTNQLLVLLLLCAAGLGCSGSTSEGTNDDDDGAEGEGQLRPPTKDGVPIGGCRELSAAELSTAHCPTVEPEHLSACDAPSGTTCPYGIRVDSGRSSQAVYFCTGEDRRWGSALLPCGVLCSAPYPNVTELAGDCADRPVTSCSAGSEAMFAFETAQQWLDDALERELRACDGPETGSIQLELVQGCPTRLSSLSPLDATVAECLRSRLERIRWDCAEQLDCGVFSRSTTAQ